MIEVRVQVTGFPDSDAEERVRACVGTAEDLCCLEVQDIKRSPAPGPLGAKRAALEWAQLAETLTGTTPGFVVAVRRWPERHPGGVTLESESDRVTLFDGLSREGRELLAARGQD